MNSSIDFNKAETNNALNQKNQFKYDLPEKLIAQRPIEPRDSSKLMVINKESGEISHKIFYEITDFLNPGDCLILNDSKVIPARLFGEDTKSGKVIEFLLL